MPSQGIETMLVISYDSYTETELDTYRPRVVHVDADNEIVAIDDLVGRLAAG